MKTTNASSWYYVNFCKHGGLEKDGLGDSERTGFDELRYSLSLNDKMETKLFTQFLTRISIFLSNSSYIATS